MKTEYRLTGKGKIPKIVDGVFDDISLRHSDCEKEGGGRVYKLSDKKTKEPIAVFLTRGNRLILNNGEESLLAEEIRSGLEIGGLVLKSS